MDCFFLIFQMVVISDPHIKTDPEWSLYREARDGGHFVKTREGELYKGLCWPGNVFLTINCSLLLSFKKFDISDDIKLTKGNPIKQRDKKLWKRGLMLNIWKWFVNVLSIHFKGKLASVVCFSVSVSGMAIRCESERP